MGLLRHVLEKVVMKVGHMFALTLFRVSAVWNTDVTARAAMVIL